VFERHETLPDDMSFPFSTLTGLDTEGRERVEERNSTRKKLVEVEVVFRSERLPDAVDCWCRTIRHSRRVDHRSDDLLCFSGREGG
jgi:hypothetical protein